MAFNQNSGYGQAQAGGVPFTTGKVFLVTDTTGANANAIGELYRTDSDGVTRVYSTITTALAACTTGRGDVVVLAPDFTTAPTAAELLAAETKGVVVHVAGANPNGTFTAYRATATLPASASTPYFTVTGRVILNHVIGEVTTIVQTQACNAKLTLDPIVGADVDMCTVLDITAAAVGAQFSITGTLADALVKTTSGTGVYQASKLILTAGAIELGTSATNTGATKWQVNYTPIDAFARIVAA